MPDRALEGIKVLDATHYIAGPYCTKLLADFGADVIKVERPDTGDPCRRLGPFQGDDPHPEKSGLFFLLNTNKRSLTLNLKSEVGKKIFRQLARQADLVVESFAPRVMPGLGLSYDVLKQDNPDLVMVSLSNFGQTGPYRDFKASELVLFGMGGSMYDIGVPDRSPVKQALSIVQFEAGAVAAAAGLGALWLAQLQGVGQQVDLSLMEAQLGGVDRRHAMLLAYQYCGEINPRQPGWLTGLPSGVQPCRDGYVEMAGGYTYWDRIVKMLGEPEALKDPKWRRPEAQVDPELAAEFDAIFLPWMMERPKQEVFAAGQAAHVFCGPLNTMEDLFNDPFFRERGFWAQVEHPVMGQVKLPGRPLLMAETPWQLRRAAPLLGQHTDEVLEALGYAAEDRAKLRETGAI